MKRSSEYPAWELHPRKLSEQEAADPFLILDEFFDYASLPQVRDKLWNWLESMVSGNFPKGLTRRQREHMMLFYAQLEKLIEGVHVLHVQNKKAMIKTGKGIKKTGNAKG